MPRCPSPRPCYSTCERVTTGLRRLSTIRLGWREPSGLLRNEPANFPDGLSPAQNPPSTTSGQFIKAKPPLRPCVLMAEFGYRL